MQWFNVHLKADSKPA